VAILHRDLRASDRDREQAVARLKAHYADGRLAEHELAWRSEAAYGAVGVSELARLTSDLPGPARRSAHRLLPLALLVLAVAAWLVMVPPELTVVLVLLLVVLTLLSAPLWIPVLLAFMAYRLIRGRVCSR
jgi:DUF1707 SHOCT-like domain